MKRRGLAICLMLMLVSGMLTGCGSSVTVSATTEAEEDSTDEEIITDTSNFLVKINYGIDSLVSYSGNTPVQITVTNQGEDFAGEIVLTVNRDYNANYGYSNDISIPAGTTKSVFMTIPDGLSYSNCVVSIADSDGDTVYERTIMNDIAAFSSSIIGVLSDDYAALNYLDGLSVTLAKNYTCNFALGQMTEETMPDIASALNTCRIIMIDNFDTSRLSDAQYQALRQWVENGGILLLGTGAEYSKVLSKFKDDFVSGSIGSLTNKKLEMTGQQSAAIVEETEDTTEANDDITIGTETPEEDAEADGDIALPEGDDTGSFTGDTLDLEVLDISVDGGSAVEAVASGELFIEKQLGVGKVVVCKTAFGMEPFSGYDQNINVIAGLLNAVVTEDLINIWNGTDTSYEYQMESYIIDSAGQVDIPDSGKYIVLFVLYILLVGPGIYILLKWKDKNKLLWLAIPAIALLFTGGVYVISINDNVRYPIVTSYTMERYEENSKTVCTGFSVMNPKSEAYEINLDSKYSQVTPVNSYNYLYTYNNSDRATCLIKETIDHTLLKMNKSQAFTPIYFRATATEATEQNIDIDILAYTDGFEGTVTNNLDCDLIYVVVCMSGYVSYFDRIPAGETVEVKKDSTQQSIYDAYQFLELCLGYDAYYTDRTGYNMVSYMSDMLTIDFDALESGDGFVAGYAEGQNAGVSPDDRVIEYGQVLSFKAFHSSYADISGEYTINIHNAYLVDTNGDWDTQYGYNWDCIDIEATYDFEDDGINTLYYIDDSYRNTSYTMMDCYIWNPQTRDWQQIFADGETEFALDGYFIDEEKTQIMMMYTCSGSNSYGDYRVPTIAGGEK